MVTAEEIETWLSPDGETDRIEFTESTKNIDKFSEAICAFANDYNDYKLPGYLLIGVKKTGQLSGLKVTDELQKDIASIRSNGQVSPQPAINMDVIKFDEGEILIVETRPAPHPPVRYKGKVWIRVGPSKAVANEIEERRLVEKRTATARTFDALPCWDTQWNDLAIDIIKISYLPLVIDREILEKNHRDLVQQLASLRLYDLKHQQPTNAGILLFGIEPLFFLQGAYIEYIKMRSTEKDFANIENTVSFKGALYDVLREIDVFINKNIVQTRILPIPNTLRDMMVTNYPYRALREFVMNAIMHRDYESNSPVYIYEFNDRIEIHNAGYLYGQVTKENFPQASDYRNPVIAEAMKSMGYVNKFNFGIYDAQQQLEKNGNAQAIFYLNLQTKIAVSIPIHPLWQNE